VAGRPERAVRHLAEGARRRAGVESRNLKTRPPVAPRGQRCDFKNIFAPQKSAPMVVILDQEYCFYAKI
jgi:hypothetical protein